MGGKDATHIDAVHSRLGCANDEWLIRFIARIIIGSFTITEIIPEKKREKAVNLVALFLIIFHGIHDNHSYTFWPKTDLVPTSLFCLIFLGTSKV